MRKHSKYFYKFKKTWRQLILNKYFSVIKYSLKYYLKVSPLIKNDKFYFFLKILKGFNFIEFQKNPNNEKEFFDKKYKFKYDDWFSHNINIWKNYLTKLKEIRYLEIGSFEGRSAVFMGELDNVKEITSVDTFTGSGELCKIDFDIVYKNCSENLDELKIPNNLVKDTSHNFFINNNKKFNVIYIDGSHFYEDVKKDFINSMNCLEDDGILICDDFYWFFYEKIEQNPSGAILECYENFKKNLDILFLNHQIIFKKKKELKK